MIMVTEVEVTTTVRVTVDTRFFSPKFMKEFRDSFYSFESIDDHIRHLAQLNARGIIDDNADFLEGYGNLKGTGIKIQQLDTTAEIAGQ